MGALFGCFAFLTFWRSAAMASPLGVSLEPVAVTAQRLKAATRQQQREMPKPRSQDRGLFSCP
jgi:hypothetical protein